MLATPLSADPVRIDAAVPWLVSKMKTPPKTTEGVAYKDIKIEERCAPTL